MNNDKFLNYSDEEVTIIYQKKSPETKNSGVSELVIFFCCLIMVVFLGVILTVATRPAPNNNPVIINNDQ